MKEKEKQSQIELITNLDEIEKLSTCNQERSFDSVVLIRVLNNEFDQITIPLSDSRKGLWYSPESIIFIKESEKGDTLFSRSRTTISSFTNKLDTLKKGEQKCYCIEQHHFIRSTKKYQYGQFFFPYYATMNPPVTNHFQLLAKYSEERNNIKQMPYYIPKDAKSQDEILIDDNRHVVYFSE